MFIVVLCATIDLSFGFNPVNYSTNESSGFVSLTVQMLNGTISGDEIIQVRVSTTDNTAESKPYTGADPEILKGEWLDTGV